MISHFAHSNHSCLKGQQNRGQTYAPRYFYTVGWADTGFEINESYRPLTLNNRGGLPKSEVIIGYYLAVCPFNYAIDVGTGGTRREEVHIWPE